MRLIVQRVKKAEVKNFKTKKVVGSICGGYLVLLGFKKGDSEKDCRLLSEKISKLRVMADRKNKMNLSLKDAGGEVLLISQFTLYAETKGQNRPSFTNALEPQKAQKLYHYFCRLMENLGIRYQTGSFGDYMEISALLDGPVTITLDS